MGRMRPIIQETFPPVTLRGERVVLRPIASADVPAIAEACGDEVIQEWLPLPNPYRLEDARWFVDVFAPQQLASGDGIVFGIEFEGRLAGAIDLKRTDWRARATEIGYWTAPWARGRGVMTEAVRTLSTWLIRDRAFTRLEIRAATGNLASQRVALAAGYQREGVARNGGFVHSGLVDLAVFSLIEADLG